MVYDLIIIGAGPAGLTASIYASRERMSNLVMGKLLGGTITYAHKVDNFPGLFNISGVELGQKMTQQAKALGGEFLLENAGGVRVAGDNQGFEVVTESGQKFVGKTLIVASGTERRKLNIPGEKEYLGKGVSYCANCDAPFFKGKIIVLVGGANAACSSAVHLAEFADKIYLIYRKNELRAEPVWVEEVKANPKIEVIYNTNLVEILGDGQKVSGAKLDNPYNNSEVLKVDGVFVEIGGIPTSHFLVPLEIKTNEEGYIEVDDEMRTNIPGIFAAGDATTKSLVLQQTITACGQGAIAGSSSFKYLKTK